MTTHIADDGTVRQAHYGEGEQPWDVIVRLGWAPEFSAGNVLKYLRRTKAPEHSLESARWYYARLVEMVAVGSLSHERFRAFYVIEQLKQELTQEEIEKLV